MEQVARFPVSEQICPGLPPGLPERTMKYAAVVALATCLISSAALAQSLGEKTGINPALGIAPTTADFVKQAAISDMT